MTSEQLEQFVSKLVMRLSDIESVKTSTDAVKTALLELKSDYGIRQAKIDAKLETIYEVVTKQNSRIYKLEEATAKERELHLACPNHAKISVLEQKVSDNKEAINETKNANNAKRSFVVALVAVVISAVMAAFNIFKQ